MITNTTVTHPEETLIFSVLHITPFLSFLFLLIPVEFIYGAVFLSNVQYSDSTRHILLGAHHGKWPLHPPTYSTLF